MHYVKNSTAQAIVSEMPQIMSDEGLIRSIYLDSENYASFGFGTLIIEGMPEYGLPEGTVVTEARCIEAFFAELSNKTIHDGENVFGRRWKNFPFEVKKVYVNFLYNVGATKAKKFVRMVAAAKDHDWQLAAIEMLDSKYARQVGSRADRLANRLRAV